MNANTQAVRTIRNGRSDGRSRSSALSRNCFLLVAGLAIAGVADAGLLTVPNGDFSVVANAGTVGGGIVGSSGADVPIGSGPWTATFEGVIGLLVPPTLEISSATRSARISNVAGASAVTVVNNGGHFGQTLTATTQSNKRYTLIGNLSTSVVLDLPLLATAGTGIALYANGAALVSSTTAPAGQVRIDAVDATTSRIQIYQDTGTVTPAPIAVRLFDRPQGLLSASVIDAATFSDIKVAESAIPPDGNTTLTVTGGGSQGVPVGQPFPVQMTAVVRDQNGNPVPNTLVTLTAPPTGASATLHAGGESGRIIVAFTDANGQITFTADANEIAGCYSVIGQVEGIPHNAVFRLRNYSPNQVAAYLAAHPGANGMPQDSVFCNGFEG
ncbi:MAG TPA: hypothetical protein VLF18_10395 [Tahibacter sp.]|uniref:hypothetical protein n=1 Tax=Tahibacter sp. TaxID=2056211 RepID=UPI002B6AD9FB|nr:hypothetical protein [Tahibacter sp.]HSX60598.1 hypothetical protein [Tahibacter sp.]